MNNTNSNSPMQLTSSARHGGYYRTADLPAAAAARGDFCSSLFRRSRAAAIARLVADASCPHPHF
jgi:hypothetical protein